MDFSTQFREGKINLEALIDAKNPRLRRWIPGFVLAYLKRVIHLDEVNESIAKHKGERGVQFAENILQEMAVEYEAEGMERVRPDGRYILVSNHPLGGLDGMVLIALFGRKFEKVYFPVNDLLTSLPQFSDIFLPVNKHGAQTQENARRLEAAYASSAQMLYFPAGLCSRKGKGGVVRDLEWKPSFIAKAIEHQRDVVPLYFAGKNSNFFYNLAQWRKRLGVKANIEMLYLVDEMYRQQGARLKVVVGDPIPWQTFQSTTRNRREWASWVKGHTYALAGAPSVEIAE